MSYYCLVIEQIFIEHMSYLLLSHRINIYRADVVLLFSHGTNINRADVVLTV